MTTTTLDAAIEPAGPAFADSTRLRLAMGTLLYLA